MVNHTYLKEEKGKMSIERKLLDLEFKMDFILDPPADQWEKANEKEEKYICGDYELRLIESKSSGPTSLLTYTIKRKDSALFCWKQSIFTVNVPLVDVHKIWRPKPPFVWTWIGSGSGFPPGFKERTSAVHNIPLMLAVNRSGENRFAFGFLDQGMETELSGKVMEVPCTVYPADGYCSLGLKRPVDGLNIRTREVKDTIYTSKSRISWYELMGRYSRENDSFVGFHPRKSPPDILAPFWTPWYAHGFDVSVERLYEAAKKAIEYGFKNIAIAWWYHRFYDRPTWGRLIDFEKLGLRVEKSFRERMKREQLNPLFDSGAGDWSPSHNLKRFPNLGDLVAKIQKLGGKVNSHFMPFIVGIETDFFEKSKQYLFETSDGVKLGGGDGIGGYLCPQTAFAQEWVPKFVAQAVERYNLDSLWFDYIDFIPVEPCVAKHEHVYQSMGEAVSKCLESIYQKVKEVNPEVWITTRLTNANINNKRYFDIYCEGDPLTDWDFNRGVMSYVRSFTHVNHNDAIGIPFSRSFFPSNETDENLAKIMGSVVLTGIPYLDVDFFRTSDDKLDILRNWVRFYIDHQEDLIQGEFRPLSFDPTATTLRIESKERAYLGFFARPFGKTPLTRAFKEIYLVNGTESEDFATILTNQNGKYETTIFDRHLKCCGTRKLRTEDGQLLVNVSVPEGGMVKLRRIPAPHS